MRSAGAIGTDALGDALLAALERDGVDTTHLLRREDVQTSASVLPIRPDGSRPALHCVGANATYGAGDVTDAVLDGATHLHLGGPEFMGGEAAAGVLERARARGITTSADVLAPGDMGVRAPPASVAEQTGPRGLRRKPGGLGPERIAPVRVGNVVTRASGAVGAVSATSPGFRGAANQT